MTSALRKTLGNSVGEAVLEIPGAPADHQASSPRGKSTLQGFRLEDSAPHAEFECVNSQSFYQDGFSGDELEEVGDSGVGFLFDGEEYSYRSHNPRSSQKRRRPNRNGQSASQNNSAIARTPLYLGLFPPGKRLTLRYSEILSLNPASGGLVGYTFSANGCYDPNISGIGHQPYGFDQIMSYYNHYVVHSSSIAVMPHSQGGNDAYLFIKLQDTSSLAVSIIEHIAEENAVAIANQASIFFSGKKLTMNYSAREFFRVKDPVLADDLYGSNSTNPQDQAYYIVGAAAAAGEDPPAVSFLVTIDYDVVFLEPKVLPHS